MKSPADKKQPPPPKRPQAIPPQDQPHKARRPPPPQPAKSPKAKAKTSTPRTQAAQAKAWQVQSQKLAQAALTSLQSARARLATLDLEALAHATGFIKRRFRKLSPLAFLQGLLALSAESLLSLERIASAIGLAAGVTYTKQALHKRLGPALEQWIAQTAVAFLGQLAHPKVPALLRSFARVLLQDSTVETVPKDLAADYPGGRNQKTCVRAALKIQLIADLLQGKVLHWSLSGFTRNDQAAAPDILSVAQAGDLVIRDLGYFALPVFAQLAHRGAFFLSRYRHGVQVYQLNGQPLDLYHELLRQGTLDRWVLLGHAKVPMRLVAQPAPEALANARRRLARANHDGRSQPTQARLRLLSWTILVTNVLAQVWSARDSFAVYRLRWRIEIVFKTWKSYLGLHRLNTRTGPLLGLSAAIKLLFCALTYRQCHDLELLDPDPRHVSLLRLARIFEQCAALVTAAVLNLSGVELLAHHFRQHLHYEHRSDRTNFFEFLAQLS